MLQLFVSNTNRIYVWVKVASATYENGYSADANATLAMDILDQAGNVVTNGSAIPIPHVAAGQYSAAIPSNLNVADYEKYTVHITGTTGGDADIDYHEPLLALKRKAG